MQSMPNHATRHTIQLMALPLLSYCNVDPVTVPRESLNAAQASLTRSKTPPPHVHNFRRSHSARSARPHQPCTNRARRTAERRRRLPQLTFGKKQSDQTRSKGPKVRRRRRHGIPPAPNFYFYFFPFLMMCVCAVAAQLGHTKELQ